MMKTEVTCPACNYKISLWHIFTSFLPFYLKCPNCKSKLVLQDEINKRLYIVIGVLAAISFVLGFTGVLRFYDPDHGLNLTAIGILVAIVIPASLILSLYTCNSGKLIVKK